MSRRQDATAGDMSHQSVNPGLTGRDTKRHDLQEPPEISVAGEEPAATVATAFRSILAQLEMLSHGSTQAWNATAKGESDNPRPFGELKPDHEEFRDCWDQAPEAKRPEVLEAARERLDQRRGVNRAQNAQEWDEERWIIEDGEGFEAVEVARRFNTSTQRVRKLRIAKGREAEFGKLYQAPEPVDRDAKVLELVGKGMSTRAIALIVRLPKSEVQRIKQRAA